MSIGCRRAQGSRAWRPVQVPSQSQTVCTSCWCEKSTSGNDAAPRTK